MIFPSTYETTLWISILSMLCLGSWANTLKVAGRKWRFELYYFDYAFGVLIAALLAAFTFGSMGQDLSFQDNLLIAGKRQMAYAMAAGGVFNLANILLAGAMTIAGLSVAFPMALGLALVLGLLGRSVQQRTGDPGLIFGGAAVVLLAVLLAALAYAARRREEPAATTSGVRPGNQRSVRRSGPLKGIVISIVSGLLMGASYPLITLARAPGLEIGLGPYALAVFFAIGIFTTTIVYNIYFMNLPLDGEPIELGAYLKGTLGQHLLGVFGGLIWCTGTVCNLVAGAASGVAQLSPALSYLLGQGGALVSVLWGLLVWREFAGAGVRAVTFIVLMFVAFTAGLGLIALSSRY